MVKGIADRIADDALEAVGEGMTPLEVIDRCFMPAMEHVGELFGQGKMFLPQVVKTARVMKKGVGALTPLIEGGSTENSGKEKALLATVKGDVHDIGKNIVKVILENYGFEVIDLGRDVPVETVVDNVREKDVHLVGLSALMTTTLKSMEETIAALHAAKLDCKIMVGGAVLTPEYAEKIGADWYAKDAKRSADIAKEFFGV